MNPEKNQQITAEIVRNYLETVSREISAIVENTAMSPIFTLTHDYSCGICCLHGDDVQLVARDLAVPTHIFSTVESVRTVLGRYRSDLRPGDTFLVCDPYMGGTHIPDWTVIRPVFIGERPAFFTIVRGHINDAGGPMPGNYNAEARDIWQEGFRIPPLRIVRAGEPVPDLWRVILANTRTPPEVTGDLKAMIGACSTGERRLLDLIARYGATAVEGSVAQILHHSEVQMRREIARWPDGAYRHVEYVDHDYAGHRDLPIAVTVTIAGDSLTVDFAGSSGEAAGYVNSPPCNSMAQVFIALTAMCPHIPVNSGLFRPIRVVLPEHSIVNPRAPAPVGHCTLVPATTITDAVMKALEQVAPERVGTASCDMAGNRCFGVDSRTGRFWISSDMAGSPMSAGGAYGTDGWGAWAATFSSLRIPPLEVFERQFPWRYELAEYAIDTAAPGRWRGAPAHHYRRVNLDSMRANVYNSGYRNSLAGYAGGRRGAGNYWVLREGAPDELRATECSFAELLPAGSRVFSQSGAGGGWGDPMTRDPAAVLEDWLDEIVSLEGARRDYAVVIDPGSRRVDHEATEALRARRRHVDAIDGCAVQEAQQARAQDGSH